MNRLMIIVGSVRPGRIGLPIARWVEQVAAETGQFDVDFVDLAELGLPFMDESAHPMLHRYEKPHTLAWSARVAAAGAFVFVTPEYNHSYPPALKNALDYLHAEWRRKPVGFVSYGGVSGGTRAVAALKVPVVGLGLVPAQAAVEIPFGSRQLTDGTFGPTEQQAQRLVALLAELGVLSDALRPLQG